MIAENNVHGALEADRRVEVWFRGGGPVPPGDRVAGTFAEVPAALRHLHG